jgi:hypothetical protein
LRVALAARAEDADDLAADALAQRGKIVLNDDGVCA